MIRRPWFLGIPGGGLVSDLPLVAFAALITLTFAFAFAYKQNTASNYETHNLVDQEGYPRHHWCETSRTW